MTWQKGQSGNSVGRPKAVAGAAARLARLIDDATDGGKRIITALVKEMEQPAHTDKAQDRRVRIAEILLDRWAGKPQQSVTVQAAVVQASVPVSALTASQLDAVEIALAPVVAGLLVEDTSNDDLPDAEHSRDQ